MLNFLDATNDDAHVQARQRAIEIVSTNTVWIELKEDEIIEAFAQDAKATKVATAHLSPELKLLRGNKLKENLRAALKAKKLPNILI